MGSTTQQGKAVTKRDTDTLSALAPSDGLTYTVANARSGKGGLSDSDAVLSDLRRRQSAVGRIAGNVMFDASLAAYRLITASESMSQRDYAEGIGVAQSYASRLVRIGRFVVDMGVTKGSERFTFLASHGSNARVGALLKDFDEGKADKAATVKGLDALVAEVKEHGKITSGARTPRPDEGDRASDKADKAESETGTTETRVATIGDVLDALDAMVRGLDRETWAATETRLAAIVEREVTIRTKAAQDEAQTVKGETVPKPSDPRKGRGKAA